MSATRPRGFIDSFDPKPGTQRHDILVWTQEILGEYADNLPLAARQIYYRIVGRGLMPKDKHGSRVGYLAVCDVIALARRARLIPMSAIRDDGFTAAQPAVWENAREWLDAVKAQAGSIRLDRQHGQRRRLVVWCEAAGMIPQLERVAEPYGVPVFSSGGFDSLSVKYQQAEALAGNRDTTVLHLGDFDGSGEHIFTSLEADIIAFAREISPYEIEFRRIALTAEQVDAHTEPSTWELIESVGEVHAHDQRRQQAGELRKVQLEALPPDVIAAILNDAICEHLDSDAFKAALRRERIEQIVAAGRVEDL